MLVDILPIAAAFITLALGSGRMVAYPEVISDELCSPISLGFIGKFRPNS
jgi:hypothetical protein